MPQQLGTLFLVASHPTELQSSQDLDQDLAQGGHHEGRVQVAKATNDAHG